MNLNKDQDTSGVLKLNSSIPQMQRKIKELKYESGSAFLQGGESKAGRDSLKRQQLQISGENVGGREAVV